jgi:alkylated DNA repair dioxygenase AlkB
MQFQSAGQVALFQHAGKPDKNLLPKDGSVIYYGPVFPIDTANHYLETLMQTIEWRHDKTIIFGKKIQTKREVAWYGDRAFAYTYSKTTKYALPWTALLREIKAAIENCCGETFNSCLLNLYHDGSEGMGWHSDDEPELKKDGAIASVSFGAARKFSFKHKQDADKAALLLEHGSLLLMKAPTQQYWLHQIPPAKSIAAPRVNLTFRTMNQ